MQMTRMTKDDQMLDDLFGTARDDAGMQPSSDLMARVLGDAHAVQSEAAQSVRDRTPEAGIEADIWRRLLALLGGWTPVAGLALTAAAGVGIGFGVSISLLPDGIETLTGGNAEAYLSDLSTGYTLGLAAEES